MKLEVICTPPGPIKFKGFMLKPGWRQHIAFGQEPWPEIGPDLRLTPTAGIHGGNWRISLRLWMAIINV